MSYPNERECEHGQLRRSCPHCEYARDEEEYKQTIKEQAARIARLEQAALIAIHALAGGDRKAEVRDIYDESPQQSLAAIQAEAVEGFGEWFEGKGLNSHDSDEVWQSLKEYAQSLRDKA